MPWPTARSGLVSRWTRTATVCRCRAVRRRYTTPATEGTDIYRTPALAEPAHHAAAAQWAEDFNSAGARAIPKTAYETSMSRSSGAGGQVNRASVGSARSEAEMCIALAECQQAEHKGDHSLPVAICQHRHEYNRLGKPLAASVRHSATTGHCGWLSASSAYPLG